MNVGRHTVKMQVWDTAGQERFRTITQTYYKGAAAILLVYDCTDRKTFDNITSWMKQIDTYAAKDVVKIIVANKVDRSDREVATEEGKALAAEFGCPFFETSAKTGEKVNDLFTNSAELLAKATEKKPSSRPIDDSITTIRDGDERKRKWRMCKWLTF